MFVFLKITDMVFHLSTCTHIIGAEVFRDLASHTGGQFFALTSSSELVGFSKFVASSLETDTTLSAGATVTITTGKRSLGEGQNAIFVDRTIRKFIVAISVQMPNTANAITLRQVKIWLHKAPFI